MARPESETGRLGGAVNLNNPGEGFAPWDEREAQPKEAPASEAHRPGDAGIGTPGAELAPAEREYLTDEQSAARREKAAQALEEEFDERLAELAGAGGFGIPAGLRKLGAVLLVALAAALGFFMVGQTAAFLTTLGELPPQAFYAAAGGMALLGLVLLVAILQLLVMALRLRRSPRVPLPALEALRERRRWQALARARQDDARKELEKWLKDYDVAPRRPPVWFKTTEGRERQRELGRVQERLLTEGRRTGSSAWLQEFAADFQRPLDEMARGIVRRHANRAALATAACPSGFIDQMITLSISTLMVAELMKVYALRPAWGQSVVIVARGIVTAYVAGQLQDVTEQGVDALADLAAEGTAQTAGAALAAGVGKAAGARAAEGALNGILVRRLGAQAIRMMQPVRR